MSEEITGSITGAQSLITSLEAAGVEHIFGIPGGAILPAYDPLMDSKIRHILVRHEQGAGHAAQGYAAATGRVGVCMATSGPGATNLVTPIADAHMDSVPTSPCTRRPGRSRTRSPARRARRPARAARGCAGSRSPSAGRTPGGSRRPGCRRCARPRPPRAR